MGKTEKNKFQFINKRITDLPANLNFGKMCKHEEKHCPSCNILFECKPGNITQCQCYGIFFSDEEKELIAAKHADCLCRQCLVELKNEFTVSLKQLPL